MTLTHIRYFVEAARCENFTKAAQNLFIAQPNLSKQIAVMENELGVKLFLRENRAVRLTDAGSYLYEQLKDLPEATAAAFEHARALGRAGTGKSAVGILEGLEVDRGILDKLSAFREANPQLELSLERGGFSQLRRGLRSGHYDMIITLSFDVEETEGVCLATLVRQRGVAAVNRKNPITERENLSLSDLRREKFVAISPEESPLGYRTFLRQCAAAGFVPTVVQRPASLESLLLCVEAGIGVALIDPTTRLGKNADIRFIPLPGGDFVNVVAVWPEDGGNRTIRALVGALSE